MKIRTAARILATVFLFGPSNSDALQIEHLDWIGREARLAVVPRVLADRQLPFTAEDAASEMFFRVPTALLGRGGNVISDAPPLGIARGAGGETGAGVADTVQQREQIYTTLQQQQDQLSAQAVPQPNPTRAAGVVPPPTTKSLPPSTLAETGSPDPRLAQAAPPANPPVISDVKPAPVLPPAPPVLPRAPLADQPSRRPPPPVVVTALPRVPLPSDVPMTEDEKRGWRLRARALALQDPYLQKQADGLIAYGAGQRKQQYSTRC